MKHFPLKRKLDLYFTVGVSVIFHSLIALRFYSIADRTITLFKQIRVQQIQFRLEVLFDYFITVAHTLKLKETPLK